LQKGEAGDGNNPPDEGRKKVRVGDQRETGVKEKGKRDSRHRDGMPGRKKFTPRAALREKVRTKNHHESWGPYQIKNINERGCNDGKTPPVDSTIGKQGSDRGRSFHKERAKEWGQRGPISPPKKRTVSPRETAFIAVLSVR